MLFKKHLQLFILLSTALFVFSCITVDKSLGDDYVPNNQDLKIKYIEFDLPLIAKSEDSLQAYSSTTGVLGYIKTKEFGNIEIANVGNISQPYTEMRFGKDPIIKSVFLNLVVTSTSTFEDGQANIPQNINVYRTIKPLDTTQIYCNSFNPSMYESTSLNSSNSVFFGADSIKIFLKNEFGTEILNATEEELDSVELFINKFRGLYLTCSAPETETGGRLNYFNSSYSSLVLTYNFQPEWEDNMARKDTSVVLNFGSSLTVSPSYYSKNLNNNEPSLTLPAQGLAGAKPYISGQKLRGIIKEWADKNDIKLENLIIARASYSLPFEYPADLDMTYYPSALFPAYRDTINNSSSVTLAKKNYEIGRAHV